MTGRTGGADTRLEVGLFVGSLALSLAGSWIPSIWADEGATISASTRSLPQLWALVQNIDMVHALYYLLIGFWFDIVPFGAVSLRMPSAFAVALCTVLVHRLARRWVPPRTATLAAVVFAILPRTTWMGVEGRSWAFSTLTAIALTLFVVRWTEDRRRRWLACYAVLAAVGIALHLYLVFLLVAHAMPLAWRYRRSPARVAPWLVAAVVGVGLASPVWLVASRQSAQIGEQKPGLLAWARQFMVNQAFLGETPGASSSGVLDLAWKSGSVGLAIACWALVAIAVVRTIRRSDAAGTADGLWWLVPWLLVPPLLVLVWSVVGRNMYNPRYFGFCVPPMAVLVAVGMASLGSRRRELVALALVAVLAVPVYVSQRTPRAKAGSDWAEVAAWVGEQAATGDGVYFAPTPTTRTISIAYPRDFSGLRDITLVRPAAQDASLAGESMPLRLALQDAPSTVFAVWRLGAEDFATDRQAFAAQGFVQTAEWSGSLHEILRFERSG